MATNLPAIAQDSDRTYFTVYLVRHAEKELSSDDPKDPPLTPCGEERAASLAVFLSEVRLDAVYSSDFLRTRNTAQPVAQDKELEVRIYDHKKLEKFAEMLLERGEDVLVVGHSNSTPALAGMLTGGELESMDERIYNRIYQVVISKGKGRLELFHSAFECDN